jgi:zinc transport system permease protein
MVELLSSPLFLRAVFASALVGLVCSALGVYVVLRRIVFVSAALAQISTLGIAFALFVDINPTLAALALSLVAVAVLSTHVIEKGLHQDSILGIAYVSAWALSILFVAKSAKGMEEVVHLVQGNILTIDPNSVIWIGLATAVILALQAFFSKEFLFVSFDPEMALAQGVSVRLWNFLLYLALGTAISLAIRGAGILPVFSFLVLPATTALLIMRRMAGVFVIAALIGVIASILGVTGSFIYDLPAGPLVVVLQTVFLSFVFLLRKITL